jgi:hypothetical protein
MSALCKRRVLCRKLTLFCILAVAILTVSILVFSGSKVRQLERENQDRTRSGDRRREKKRARKDAKHASSGIAEGTGIVEALAVPGAYRPKVAVPSSDAVPLDTYRGSGEASTHTDESKKSEKSSAVEKKKDEKKEKPKPGDSTSSSSTSSKLTSADARLAKIEYKKLHFPPLESILNNKTSGKDEYNIIGDVSFLLDFAILGHAKTATTFLTKWFADHPNMAIWEEEVCTLYSYQPAVLARKLYQDFPQSNVTTHRGFKCPGHFSYQYLRYFRRYFTNTRLIVGVRHPVRWFESYYNFLARKGHELPSPRKLMGSCSNHEHKGFCTDRAQFHQNLAKFGKTNLRDPAEKALLRLPRKSKDFLRTDNPIFLYDMSQIYDSNQTRLEQFKADLGHFLRLPTPLPDASAAADKTTTSRVKKKVLNICLDEHEAVRKELVQIGTRASMWIRKYFMKLDPAQVTISNREFFELALKEWKYDPCLATNASSGTTGLSQVFKPKSIKAAEKL